MSGILTGLLVALSIVVLLRALRFLARRRGWRGRGLVARRLLRRIDATPEQERLFLAELDALRSVLAEVRGGLHASREELARALESDRLEPSALEALAAEPLRRLDAARARLAEGMARIHAALAPEQRVRLAAALRAGPGRHGRRCGPHARPC